MNGIRSHGVSDRKTNEDAYKTSLNARGYMNTVHPYASDAINDRNAMTVRGFAQTETFGKFEMDEKFNGYHTEQEAQNGFLSTSCSQSKFTKRESRPHTASTEIADSRCSGKVSLFVANIESEDIFREMIRPYNPVSIKVTLSKGKWIAFVKMSTEEAARQTIRGLHNKQQQTKCLFVDFCKSQHDKSDSDYMSEESSSDPYPGTKSKMMAKRVVNQNGSKETCGTLNTHNDYTDMPPLVHLSTLGPDADKYHLDCSINVTNFPCNTLESALRNAFVKYHVLDICMVNNGSGPGCTKAILYLLSVYDVIKAVIEMDGSCILTGPLKVDVPYHNTVLRAVVEKVKSKRRVSTNLLSPTIGNSYSQSLY